MEFSQNMLFINVYTQNKTSKYIGMYLDYPSHEYLIFKLIFELFLNLQIVNSWFSVHKKCFCYVNVSFLRLFVYTIINYSFHFVWSSQLITTIIIKVIFIIISTFCILLGYLQSNYSFGFLFLISYL